MDRKIPQLRGLTQQLWQGSEWRQLGLVAALILLVLLIAWPPAREKNIIRGRSPFLHDTTPYEEARRDHIIKSVRSFAESHGMGFLQSSDDSTLGDFSAWAVDRDLNLLAIHQGTVNRDLADIIAVARRPPAPADQQKAREFDCVVTDQCAGSPKPE